MNTPVLAADNISYTYSGGIEALKGIDLRIERGKRLALLGANGCGKTTLLLHLNGTLKPSVGQVLMEGRPAAYDRRALMAWRNRVGLVMQDADDQLFAANVYQDVSFGPLNLGLDEAQTRARIDAALDALGVSQLRDRATHMLSFGQKKRIAIAGIVAMQPEILVLDEPTAGLDPEGVVHLLAVLQRLHANGTTLVFSTHDVDLAYSWADHIALFADGKLLQQGETVALLGDRTLLQAARLKMPLILQITAALGASPAAFGRGLPRTEAALLQWLRAMAGCVEQLNPRPIE